MISCIRWFMFKGKYMYVYLFFVWCLLIDLMDLDWLVMRIDGVRWIDVDGWLIIVIYY